LATMCGPFGTDLSLFGTLEMRVWLVPLGSRKSALTAPEGRGARLAAEEFVG
jgi:hypothetical protein